MTAIAIVGGTYVDHLVVGHTRTNDPSANVVADTYCEQWGGCAFNTAVIAARLGAEVTLYTWLSDDDLGRAAKSYAEASGVTVRVVKPVAKLPRILVLIDRQTRERQFICFAEFQAPEQAIDLLDHVPALRGHQVVHFAGLGPNVKFLGPDLANIIHAVRGNEESGGPTISGDVIKMHGFTAHDWNERLGMTMRFFDRFFPNADEILQITGAHSVDDAIEELFRRYTALSLVGVKLGHEGCRVVDKLSDPHKDFDVEPFLRDRPGVVDQTGAGDAWCGTFLAALHRSRCSETAAREANVVASECVAHVGATQALTIQLMRQALVLAPHLRITYRPAPNHKRNGIGLA